PVPQPAHMDDDIDSGGNLPLYGCQGDIHPHEHHGLQPPQHISGTVGVAGAETSPVSGGHGMYHVDGLRPPYLSHDDAVRPHPEGGPYELPDSDLTGPLHVGIPGLHPHQIGHSLDLELRVVFYRNDSLLPRYELGQGIEERGLSGAGASADKNVVPGY